MGDMSWAAHKSLYTAYDGPKEWLIRLPEKKVSDHPNLDPKGTIKPCSFDFISFFSLALFPCSIL